MDFLNLLLCLLSIKPISVVPVCIAYITYSHLRTFSIGKGGSRTSTMSSTFLSLKVPEKKFSTLGWIRRSFLEPRKWFLILKNNWNTSDWAEANYFRQMEETELEAEKMTIGVELLKLADKLHMDWKSIQKEKDF